jgi:hypothetical protein
MHNILLFTLLHVHVHVHVLTLAGQGDSYIINKTCMDVQHISFKIV